MKRYAYFIMLVLTLCASVARADHPVDVERLTASGDYYRALLAFERLPKRVVTQGASIAAGRSAWALSLTGRAIQEFDQILRDENVDDITRARLWLSRGIIEFQEGRYQTASLYAEKCASSLKDASALRAKGLTLWGEALFKLGSFGAAEEKYVSALSETPPVDKPDLHYRLGMCRMKLGKHGDARLNLESIPLGSDRTPEAMRALAELALEDKQYEMAEFWLSKGREYYPDNFLDSWVDYVLVRNAVAQDDPIKIKALLGNATKKYAPSDPWLTLLKAAVEEYYWVKKPDHVSDGK